MLKRHLGKKNNAAENPEHEQLLTVFNSMSVGMMNVDAKGVIRLYNAALLGLLDTNQNIAGWHVDDAFTGLKTTAGKLGKLMSLAKSNKFMVRDESLVLNYDVDDSIRLGITINPIRSGHNTIEGYIFVIEDITKEKSLEEERDEFISVISHELRTPITISEGSISNALLLLERQADYKLLKNSFNQAHEQIVYLANMVNDLGTLSRAERGVGDATELIDLDELASDLYAKYAPRASHKKLQLNLDIIGRIGKVETSRLYLEEILQNLITNAIKYTQQGSVTVSLRKTSAGVAIAVKDTGIGISKTDQKRIFERFYRSEDYRTRETSGTGLGLYVVQKLAHKLGITIEVDSHLNHGSTFSFILPVK